MSNNKYEFTGEIIERENGVVLHQIRALRDGRWGCAGTLGGWLESEHNLSQDGSAWVTEYAKVYGDARVSENAWIDGHAEVYQSAIVRGNVCVDCNADVHGYALIEGDAYVCMGADVRGDAKISDQGLIYYSSDYLTINHMGYLGVPLTFYNCCNGEIRVVYGGNALTIEEWHRSMTKDYPSKEYECVIAAALAISRIKFNEYGV